MIKKIVMKNLTCPMCADKIEKVLPELSYIESASFNFANQTMLLEVNRDYSEDTAIPEIKAVVDAHESGVETFVYEKRHTTIIQKNFVVTYRFVLLGAFLFAVGYLFEYFGIMRPRINLLYWTGYALIAHKVIINTYKGIKRKEYFNENVLMFIATLAAMFIEKPFEAGLVILFYSVGEHLQHRAVNQSKKEISSLLDLHVEYANVVFGEKTLVKDPMAIRKQDHLVVKNGEKIPVDGTIIKGASSLNTSALTGEAKLLDVEEGDFVLSGNINVGGILIIEAAREYKESTIARIIDLIENATNKKARTENFITRFARFYTPIVTFLAVLMFAIPSILDPGNMEEYIFRAATFLVISCPCALVLSIPLSYFAGIGASAREGILFKGSNLLDMMNDVDLIGIDKTGTLTHGNFEVAGFTNLKTLRIAASVEQYSNHPIAKSIVTSYHGALDRYDNIEEIPGYGIRATSSVGTTYVGSRRMLEEAGIENIDRKDTAGTNIFIAKNDKYIGRVVIKDKIRDNASEIMRTLLNRGYHITMLTGDNEATAAEVAYELGGINYIHSLLPEDKITHFESLRTNGKKMYVGDGINDAPLLKKADIGVAMGTGSELAIDVADIIIMDDDLSKLKRAFALSRKTKRIVYQNIALSLGVKFSFLALAGAGFINHMLLAIFADVGITLIAILNALRLIYGKKQKVEGEESYATS